MRKDLAIKLAICATLDFNTDIQREEDPVFVLPDSDLDKVLREIFTVDENGALKGDISYFMSGNGNPQIKQWIENNLFTSMRSNGGYDPKVTNDDLINEFSRKSDETVSQYSNRMLSLFADAKALEAKEKLAKESKTD